ncbi:MAG: hypothetical protein NT040_16985 [Bacteroidetes bacterium]|nr:hypothetical protein [Bacteroidota bacterium]
MITIYDYQTTVGFRYFPFIAITGYFSISLQTVSKINKHLSWLLVALFGYVLTPAALIHEFHGHEDTHCLPGKTAAIDTQHIHCKFLQIEAQVFTSPVPMLLANIPASMAPCFFSRQATPSCAMVMFACLRAPPLV